MRNTFKSVLYNIIFLAFYFAVSAWSFGFFIPATTANDLRLRRIFHPRCYPSEPVFPFLKLSAKQGNYWYHFYNVLGMHPGPPALEDGTLPLGYREAVSIIVISDIKQSIIRQTYILVLI